MSKFSELCLEFSNVICMSLHYIYSLPNLHKLSCTSKSQQFDNVVDAGVSFNSYLKCSKQDNEYVKLLLSAYSQLISLPNDI